MNIFIYMSIIIIIVVSDISIINLTCSAPVGGIEAMLNKTTAAESSTCSLIAILSRAYQRFRNAIIDGSLKLSNAIVDGSLKLSNAIVDGSLKLSNAIIDGSLKAQQCYHLWVH
jgi:hypothetical protein